MTLTCIKQGILVAAADNVVAVYYVTRDDKGIQTVRRQVEDSSTDCVTAVRQIAWTASADTRMAEDAPNAIMG